MAYCKVRQQRGNDFTDNASISEAQIPHFPYLRPKRILKGSQNRQSNYSFNWYLPPSVDLPKDQSNNLSSQSLMSMNSFLEKSALNVTDPFQASISITPMSTLKEETLLDQQSQFRDLHSCISFRNSSTIKNKPSSPYNTQKSQKIQNIGNRREYAQPGKNLQKKSNETDRPYSRQVLSQDKQASSLQPQQRNLSRSSNYQSFNNSLNGNPSILNLNYSGQQQGTSKPKWFNEYLCNYIDIRNQHDRYSSDTWQNKYLNQRDNKYKQRPLKGSSQSNIGKGSLSISGVDYQKQSSFSQNILAQNAIQNQDSIQNSDYCNQNNIKWVEKVQNAKKMQYKQERLQKIYLDREVKAKQERNQMQGNRNISINENSGQEKINAGEQVDDQRQIQKKVQQENQEQQQIIQKINQIWNQPLSGWDDSLDNNTSLTYNIFNQQDNSISKSQATACQIFQVPSRYISVPVNRDKAFQIPMIKNLRKKYST